MERRDTEINGRTYSMLLPSPLKALPLCNRVGTLVAPLLGKVGSQFKLGEGSAKDQAQQLLGPMLNSLGDALHELNSEKLTNVLTDAAFASKLTCNGELINSPAMFEKHFSQYREDMYQALIWCVWECVKDFFPQAERFIQMTRTVAKESLSPTGGQKITG